MSFFQRYDTITVARDIHNAVDGSLQPDDQEAIFRGIVANAATLLSKDIEEHLTDMGVVVDPEYFEKVRSNLTV